MRGLKCGALCVAFLVLGCAPATAATTSSGSRLHEPQNGFGQPFVASTDTPVPTPDVAISADLPTAGPPPAPTGATSGFRVQMPQLGIDLAIVEGVGGAGEPPLGVAAHYPGMKWPGQGGRSFLYAHARPGMFGPLLSAGAVGEEVDVTKPNGRVDRYTIRSFTRNWPVTDTSILAATDHEELILYTCTSWTYSDPKVVAIATP